MTLFILVFIGALFVAILIISGFEPKPTDLSRFELTRRQNNGDQVAIETANREALLIDIITMRRIAVACLLVLLAIISVAWFGVLGGIFLSLLAVFSYGAIARIEVVHRQSQNAYRQLEGPLLQLAKKHPRFFELIRHASPAMRPEPKLESREELLHLIAESQRIVTTDEKALLTHALRFSARHVRDVMRPRSAIATVGAKELLGPLVLDDLHKTGHTRFPVVDQDIDHIIGILHVRDLLSLDSKRSVTAEKAMEPRVFYIRQDQTLHHALTAFLRTYHHLFIVVNEEQETVGILTLEDTIEALIGRKIVDEFESHNDIRRVARRNLRGSNRTTKREDV